MNNPWIKVAKKKKPPYIAACDNDMKVVKFPNIHTEILPQPYLGNVDSAKVICLLLNPGYSEAEGGIELNCQKFQQALSDNLDCTKPCLVHLNEYYDWTTGGKWLRRILKPLLKRGVTYEQLEHNFAIIEYFPYHSKTFNVKQGKPLKSQLYGFDLVKQAIERGAIILIMRSETRWLDAVPELVEYQKSNNYIIAHNKRNAILSEANLGRENFARIVNALKSQPVK